MERRTQVLIVGAGPVGLSAAIELGHRSVRALLIERNDRVGHAPRAKTTNVSHARTPAALGQSPMRYAMPRRLASTTLPTSSSSPSCAAIRSRASRTRSIARPAGTRAIPSMPSGSRNIASKRCCATTAASLPSVANRIPTWLVSLRQDERSVRAGFATWRPARSRRSAADYLIGADGSPQHGAGGHWPRTCMAPRIVAQL